MTASFSVACQKSQVDCFETSLIAGDIRRGEGHRDDALAVGIEVVDAQGNTGHIVVEGAEADQHRRAGRHRAARGAVEQIARVVAQAVPFDVVIRAGAKAHDTDGQDMWWRHCS